MTGRACRTRCGSSRIPLLARSNSASAGCSPSFGCIASTPAQRAGASICAGFLRPFWGRLAVFVFGYRTDGKDVIAGTRPSVAARHWIKRPERRPAAVETRPRVELPHRVGRKSPTPTRRPAEQATHYGYEPTTGFLTSITDPNNQPIGLSYDCLSRPLSISYPDGGQASITYNYSGGLSCSSSTGLVYTGATTTKKITTQQHSGQRRHQPQSQRLRFRRSLQRRNEWDSEWVAGSNVGFTGHLGFSNLRFRVRHH
jgi:YD repeat-containing protein